MSVREAGKRGGDRVKEKYGSEFYEAIGRKAARQPSPVRSDVLRGDRR